MPNAPLEVFISYAHQDRKLKDELAAHLSNLRRQGLIRTWHDGDIVAGNQWEQQIIEHLHTADLILLLISADFLASDFCYSVEMTQAIARHDADQARVIPIILRPTDWKGAPFSILQMLPTGAKPVVNWPKRDDAFADVVKGIRKVIEDLVPNAASTRAGSTSIPAMGGRQISFWNVPFRRNPYFTGQESVLTQLHTALNASNAAALTQPQAISGLGGIGKTQIAVEYAYRHEHSYCAILWVQADTRDTLVSGFTHLAKLLNLLEKEEQDQSIIVEAVKHWLETHEQWLLILDNADDLALLDEFLPRRSTGHILLTTRAQAVGTLANGIEVEPMEAAEGSLLLLRRAKMLAPNAPLEQAREADRAAAREIVQELGGLPLALDQAAAYIEETRCGLSGYLGRYRTEHTMLLQRRGKLIKEHPEPVTTTWSLSFANVKTANPAAADLLQLCAFLHPDAIPEELLIEGAPPFVPSLRVFSDNATAFDEAISSLLAYSLVRRFPETTTLSLHRLVQAVLKESMNEQTQHEWAERTVRVVNRVFPETDVNFWSRCQRYLSHAEICALLIVQHNLSFPEAAHLLEQAGTYLKERGQYREAEPLIKRALAIREQVLGPKHPETAQSLNTLGGLYDDQSKYEQAEPLIKRALAIREQVLGPKHLETAQSLNELAFLYHDLGRYDEAESLYQQALAIRQSVLGLEHVDVTETLNNLAYLYYNQGKYEQAEPLYQRALAIDEKVLGQHHPDVATDYHNLALLYQAQGKYEQAEPLYQRALAIDEKVLGQHHPGIANDLHNLARLYQAQGKYEQAEHLYQRALAIREQMLGPEHSSTATSFNDLAKLYQAQGKYEHAEHLYQRALAIREQVLGKEHPDTVTTRENYAVLLQEMQ